MTIVKCPYCVNGSTTGPNGEHWRCFYCAGSGKVVKSEGSDRAAA